MDPSRIDWLTTFAVLAAGLAAGAVYLWRMRALGRPAPAPAATDLERRDLLGKRDALFQQLRELEDLASKRSPDQLARERYALELEAAEVLRGLDSLAPQAPPVSALGTAASAAAPVEAAQAPAPASALRGFLWGTGSVAAIAFLLYLAVGAAKLREGGPATGEVPGPAAAADPQEAAIRAALERNPDDLDARLAHARLLLARQDMMGVWNETQYVLERSPGDPRALSYQSLVRLAMGQADQALEMLKTALARAPDQVDVYVHLALVYSRLGRAEDSRRTMAVAKRRFPAQREMLDRIEAEIARAGAEAPPAAPSEDPHAGVPPPPIEARAPAAAKGKRLAGLVDVDPLLAVEVAPNAIVFITVREAGFGAGPPLAVKRFVAASFPLRFEITAADSMTGEAIPDDVLIEARIDADGDPMTRSPTDPRARLDDVKAGSGEVRLVLKRVAQ
jgi:tetratricopeptide (TPR) repeat protein